MSILSKYILKNHTSFMLLTLGLGVAIYIIIDLIEKLDVFLAIEGGASFIIPFYLAKLPGILSQILPAVFLLASVILLCIMFLSREAIALFAGGISLGVMTKILMFIAIFWACIQFFCAQVLVVYGEDIAYKIWREDVRNQTVVEKTIANQWFVEDRFFVHLDRCYESGKGEGFSAYYLSSHENEIEAIVRAKSFVAQENNWLLEDVTIIKPNLFEEQYLPSAVLPLQQKIAFFFVAQQNDPKKLDFFLLNEAIQRLEVSGSNVEDLKTIWLGKIAYSLSIIVFAFVAVAIVTYKENVYIAVISSVVVAFFAYVLTMMGDSLGRVGTIPPFVAAFAPQFFIFAISFARIYAVLGVGKK